MSHRSTSYTRSAPRASQAARWSSSSNERAGAHWVYRRDPAVRLPLARAVREVAAGVRALAPEVVLLYKSKAPRPIDEQDFRAARVLLDREGRAWLRAALRRAAPAHPWAAALAPDA